MSGQGCLGKGEFPSSAYAYSEKKHNPFESALTKNKKSACYAYYRVCLFGSQHCKKVVGGNTYMHIHYIVGIALAS